MPPSGSSRGSRPRTSAREPEGRVMCSSANAKEARVETETVFGIEIHQFSDEVEMECFTNLDEPLPHQIKPFRGFDEDDEENRRLRLLKDFFDRNKKKFVGSVNRTRFVGTVNRDPVPVHSVSAANVNESASVVNIADVITIDSGSDDEDDDVIMIGDAVIPRPLRPVCVCPTCGKTRTPRPPGNLRPKDSRARNLPGEVTASGEVTIVTDQEITSGARPKHSTQPVEAATVEMEAATVEMEVISQSENVQSVKPTTAVDSHSPRSCNQVSVGRKSLPTKLSPKKLPHPKAAAHVPGTVWLVSHGTGKTVPFKVDGTKSKMLTPAKKPAIIQLRKASTDGFINSKKLPNSFNNLAPGKTPCRKQTDVMKSPVQLTPRATGTVHHQPGVSKPNLTKPTVLNVGKGYKSGSQTSLNSSNQMQSINVVKDASSASQVRSQEINVSAVVQPPTSNVATVPADIPTPMDSAPSQVVDDVARSVVKGLIDFVCLKEQFPESYQYNYDQKRRAVPCRSVQCGELHCGLGCICISLAKKSVRRVRCNSTDCIFGCSCKSRNITPSASRHTKTVPNLKKLGGSSRRKQVLTILPDLSAESPTMSTGFGAQSSLKRYLPVQKEHGYVKTNIAGSQGSHPSDRDKNGSGCGSVSKPDPSGFGLTQKVPESVQGTRPTANVNMYISGARGSILGVASKLAMNGSPPARNVPGTRRSTQAARPSPNGLAGSIGITPNSLQAAQALPCIKQGFSTTSNGLQPALMLSRTNQGSSITPNGLQPGQTLPRTNQGSSTTHSGLRPAQTLPLTNQGSSTTPNGLHPARTLFGLNQGSSTTPNGFQPVGTLPGTNHDSSTTPNGIQPARLFPGQGSRPNLTVPAPQPRRFFGREKIPIPERALMCLTPGLGYVALDETTPNVILRDPFNEGRRKSFINVRKATEWLNANLASIINNGNLMWVVAEKSTLEMKQLHRLCIDTLKDPKCSISRTGAIFTP